MSNKPQSYSPEEYTKCISSEELEDYIAVFQEMVNRGKALRWVYEYMVITKPENIDKRLIIGKIKEVLDD